MDDNNKNEMEQIQRGLEAFLEKEIDGAGNPESGRREPGPPESPEVLEFPDARREPQDVRIIEGPWSGGRSRRERESREDEDAYAGDGEDWDDWEEEDGARDAVRAGDVVTLIGRDGEEEIRAEEAAGWCDTITNELLCRMGGRLKRFMVGDKGDAEGGACEEACL